MREMTDIRIELMKTSLQVTHDLALQLTKEGQSTVQLVCAVLQNIDLAQVV